MDDLRGMAVFAAVIEHGSMNAAARALGMTPSAVSQHVRRLEQTHGVALLHRTTRRLTLTEAGSVFHEACRDLVAAAARANRALELQRDTPSGELRIAAPSGFAGGVLARAFAPLLAQHPALSLQLFFQDERVDLTALRIDLALRVSPALPDSTLVARHLGDWRMVVCAAPAYLARRGVPTTPRDLPRHDLIVAGLPGAADGLPFTRGSVTERVPLRGRVGTSSMITARAFALEGLGIAIQPEPEVRGELAAGTLVPLLADWALPRLPVHLVTPRRDAQPAKVRHAIAALQALAA
ncbi:LysR family transcriptional regulator [Ramlibacter sp.]|uniref:LysR family transcriptional regulator n=1 Tax=Ramlibacter sp. TaxID=1917967 RepID=UPI0035B07A66